MSLRTLVREECKCTLNTRKVGKRMRSPESWAAMREKESWGKVLLIILDSCSWSFCNDLDSENSPDSLKLSRGHSAAGSDNFAIIPWREGTAVLSFKCSQWNIICTSFMIKRSKWSLCTCHWKIVLEVLPRKWRLLPSLSRLERQFQPFSLSRILYIELEEIGPIAHMFSDCPTGLCSRRT